MPFLALNGLAIPVEAESGKETPIDIGKRQRSFGGTMLTERRARKRQWSGSTAPQDKADARAIEGIIAGEGHAFPFDHQDTALLTPDLFGSKGEAPVSGTVGSIFFGKGADGASVVDANGVDESKFGTGSLGVSAASTNLFSADARDMDAVTGFSVVSTLSLDTSNKVQGSQSLKVVTTDPNGGWQSENVTVSASTAYTGSIYIKPTELGSLILRIDDNSGAFSTTAVAADAALTGKWVRITHSHTTGVGATSLQIRMFSQVSPGTTFYLDAAQMELGSTATAWVDGTRAAGTINYPVSLINTKQTDLTANVWVRDVVDAGKFKEILFAYDSTDFTKNRFRIVKQNFAGSFFAGVYGSNGVVNDLTATGKLDDGQWHMITVVMRNNSAVGQKSLEIFYDGVSDVFATSAEMPDLSKMNRLDIGNFSGTNRCDDEFRIDDLQILPYAASQAQITAWFNATESSAILPRARLTGDVNNDPANSVLVEGQINSVASTGGVVGGTYKTNLSKLSFTLDEV